MQQRAAELEREAGRGRGNRKAAGERYPTFGFTPEANLDDDRGRWPTSYAVTELTEEAERTITALVGQAVG